MLNLSLSFKGYHANVKHHVHFNVLPTLKNVYIQCPIRFTIDLCKVLYSFFEIISFLNNVLFVITKVPNIKSNWTCS